MCAASVSAPVRLYDEGKRYWQDLTDECKRYVECVNATLVRNGVHPNGLIQCDAASESLHIVSTSHPSTTVKLTLTFRSWGPVISATITGRQSDGNDFFPQEVELPIAMDLDNQIVAIYDEGRSFSPGEVASYVTQSFHRCYPRISLPCRLNS